MSFGGSGRDMLWTAKNSADGGIFIAGETNSDSIGNYTNAGEKDCYIAKTDSDGNVE